jgi:hypothetical protein
MNEGLGIEADGRIRVGLGEAVCLGSGELAEDELQIGRKRAMRLLLKKFEQLDPLGRFGGIKPSRLCDR